MDQINRRNRACLKFPESGADLDCAELDAQVRRQTARLRSGLWTLGSVRVRDIPRNRVAIRPTLQGI